MSKLILANDGIDAVGKSMLEKSGFTVVTDKVAQENLAQEINDKHYIALTVRSATKVRKDVIDACPHLKVIGRGGVGMDNIDVENKEALMTPPPPSTPPEIQLKMDELEEVKRSNQVKEQLEYMTLMSESRKRESEVILNYAKAQQLGDAAMIEEAKAEAERVKTQEESFRRQMELMFKMKEHEMDMEFKREEHGMDMQVKAVEGQQKIAQNEAMGEAKVEMMKKQASMRKSNEGKNK